jgi:hypothetical protein
MATMPSACRHPIQTRSQKSRNKNKSNGKYQGSEQTMIKLTTGTLNGTVIEGDVTVNHTVHSHQHSHTHQHQHDHQHTHTVHAHGPVHLHTHMEPPAFALKAPPAPPAHYRQRGKAALEVTLAQKAVLALMRPLPKAARIGLLDWMRTEFGTGLVIELEADELRSLRQAVMDARRVAGLV